MAHTGEPCGRNRRPRFRVQADGITPGGAAVSDAHSIGVQRSRDERPSGASGAFLFPGGRFIAATQSDPWDIRRSGI